MGAEGPRAETGRGATVGERGVSAGARKMDLSDLERAMRPGARVVVRADLNVPLHFGEVADATRVEGAAPTLERLARAGARVVVLSHLGAPRGRGAAELTLAPVAACLRERIAAPVDFAPRVSGPEAAEAVARMPTGAVLVLENTRFALGETANDRSLAGEWARWADHYANDAFGTAHRAHASTDRLPRTVRARGGLAVAGRLMRRELEALAAFSDPRRPFVVVLGGAKMTDKIDVVDALLHRVDALLVGGAMANAFLKARGLETGRSRVEAEAVDVAARMLDAPALALPVDCVVASAVEPGRETRAVDCAAVGRFDAIGDVGPRTAALFAERLAGAATVFWNGPVGAFEVPGFEGGSHRVAAALAEASARGATVVVGGGDTARVVRSAGVAERVGHVSTGGGAALDLLAGKSLPGVEALSDRVENGVEALAAVLEVGS